MAAWNRQHEGVARCVPFRMGGDEVRSTPHSALANARTPVALCALRASGVLLHFIYAQFLFARVQSSEFIRAYNSKPTKLAL